MFWGFTFICFMDDETDAENDCNMFSSLVATVTFLLPVMHIHGSAIELNSDQMLISSYPCFDPKLSRWLVTSLAGSLERTFAALLNGCDIFWWVSMCKTCLVMCGSF